MRLGKTCLPRDAYFGDTEDVPLEEAVGRVAAEMITPHPRGCRGPAGRPTGDCQWWVTGWFEEDLRRKEAS